MPEANRIHRINVNFSEAAWATLQDLAGRNGKTVSAVIRDAIALERWFSEQVEAGNKVLVERPDGRTMELIPRA